MKTALKTALVVVIAIISIPVTELSMANWLPVGASLFDATQTINLWLFCIVPVGLVVVTLQALALWRIYRSNPLRYGLIYGCVVVLLHTFFLHRFFNPPADIAMYVLTDVGVMAIVFGGFNALFWRKAADQAPRAE
ncbi:MAG: hypothetical protein F4171_07080 [Gammaproteobacteria bacterium]|nr:hypothetical protein [Gammaproteobacteria bacterium]MXY04765.1 hypothetical protein [Gammaproteobacteria bacterium]MYF12285.1 hypothetical protein [Gammaproteobacteria bacterium]MYG12547.1 hypothetical protein [Gammaproteobacteria bacterium]MYH14906.1 hypothetical protein [Gammaproteobacteria bacterium]